MRILHLVPVDGIGGVEIAAKSVLAHPDPACNFHLLFIEPELRARRSGPLRLLNANRRAFDEAMAYDPDVIICSLWRSVPLALALRKARRRTSSSSRATAIMPGPIIWRRTAMRRAWNSPATR